ncbi:MAG TPA: regulatory protein RecX [Bacillota bacterium]|nr:regulatory protein RecX [Bacillota bacterium]HPT86656.1 regulatory protein RecX [Bacillota bacterium]
MTEQRVLDAALKLLAKQDYSRAELCRRLLKAGFEESEIIQSLERLRSWGYLDDCKYGIARVESLKAKLKSRNYIRMVLANSGLDADLIENIIKDYYPLEDEIQVIISLLRKRSSRRRSDIQEWNYLVRTGFDEEAIRRCLPEPFDR